MGLLNIRKPDGSWEEVANVGGTYIEEPTTGEKFLGGLKLDDNTLKVEDGKLSVNTTIKGEKGDKGDKGEPGAPSYDDTEIKNAIIDLAIKPIAQGNLITVKDSADYKLQDMVVRGKNLFDVSTAKGIDCDVSIDNNHLILTAITPVGAQYGQYIVTADKDKIYSFYCKAKKNTKGIDGGPEIIVRIYGSDDNGLTFKILSNLVKTDPIEKQDYELSKTILSGYSMYKFLFYNNSNTPVTLGEQTEYFDIQLELGSVATPYQPYVKDIDVTVCGNTLWDMNNVFNGYFSGDGEIIGSSTTKSLYNEHYIRVYPGMKLTSNRNIAFGIYDNNKQWVKRTESKEYLVEEGVSYVRLSCYSAIGITGQNIYVIFENMGTPTINKFEIPQTTTIDATTQTGWENLRTYKGLTNIIPSVEANIEMQYIADTKLYIDNKLSELTAMTLEV